MNTIYSVLTNTFLLILLFAGTALTLHAAVPDQDFEILYELVDHELQAKLESIVAANPAWQNLVNKKRMAVGVVDMSKNNVRFARINGNVMMYAASMPKIAILMAAYASFEDGTLTETEEIHKDLARMIRTSSNMAATRVIDLVGFDKIATVLSDPAYGLYDESKGGGLWVGKRYAQEGKRLGDPMFNISHGATVTQTCRFYYLLATRRLINPRRSAQMLEDLADPGLHHKFVNAIDQLAPDAKLFRKSGTWKNWHADSIMVHGNAWRNYILVAMVESAKGETIIRSILPSVEQILN